MGFDKSEALKIIKALSKKTSKKLRVDEDDWGGSFPVVTGPGPSMEKLIKRSRDLLTAPAGRED